MDEPLPSASKKRLIRLSCSRQIRLFIHIKNAAQANLLTDTGGQFDAVYLDAFSPACNPECWTREFFVQLREVMTNNGVLSTYCAKGDVRRAMLAAGMKAKKIPGPAGKREMLIALSE
jgi:tRNA U34 5-methylaminomethyl-2-thiouridine-forming methyltransferase MnmC